MKKTKQKLITISGTGENEVGLRKILDFTRLGSMVFLFIHFYYSCYGCFEHWELTAELSDRFLVNITRTGLLDSPLKSKLLALALPRDFIVRKQREEG